MLVKLIYRFYFIITVYMIRYCNDKKFLTAETYPYSNDNYSMLNSSQFIKP